MSNYLINTRQEVLREGITILTNYSSQMYLALSDLPAEIEKENEEVSSKIRKQLLDRFERWDKAIKAINARADGRDYHRTRTLRMMNKLHLQTNVMRLQVSDEIFRYYKQFANGPKHKKFVDMRTKLNVFVNRTFEVEKHMIKAGFKLFKSLTKPSRFALK